ncbi:DUF6517 family protein [Natrialbaceae archaeon GCM10025810]|uniref:DUF6517 family protein n=1 Tax=Halovalidus salilacus TaxID=3075124 RepID=UPI00360CA79D
MTHSRRSLLAAAAGATVALSAGCLDFATGDGPLEFESDRVAPTDEALEDAEFEEEDVREEKIDEDLGELVDVDVDRRVEASFWISAYVHNAEFGDGSGSMEAAVFTALSIPGMDVLGSNQNPISDMDNDEIVDEFKEQLETDQGSLREVEHDTSYDLEVLDDERTVDVFDAVVERDGEEYDVVLEMASFDHEDDIIVLVGVYPEELEEDEPPIDDLMASVEHPI